MNRIEIKKLFRNEAQYGNKTVTVAGWIRTIRSSKSFGFIELNDGSFFKNLQVVFEESKLSNYDKIENSTYDISE